jgi:agmatine deiminase
MMTRRTILKSVLSSTVAATALGSLNLNASAGTGISTGAGAEGYVYVDEAARHARTFMQWPVNRDVHPEQNFLNWLQKTIADVANTIVEFEPVVMLMAKDHQNAARKLLSAKVEIWDLATDDLWCRDSGPHFVSNGASLAVSQLNFNGWGNKQIHDNDGKIAATIAERLNLPVFNNGIIGEAGGIEANGSGLLLAHESSWVNPNRNQGTRDKIGNKLIEAYGAKKIIWAPGIIGADITDYHIDSLARLVDKNTVLIQMPKQPDTEDPWSVAAFKTLAVLESATNSEGEKLNIEKLPEPQNVRSKSADFVTAYANYYICNGAIIGARFGDKDTDAESAAILKRLYPGREIIQLNIDAIGEIGGGIHCATHEQPEV